MNDLWWLQLISQLHMTEQTNDPVLSFSNIIPNVKCEMNREKKTPRHFHFSLPFLFLDMGKPHWQAGSTKFIVHYPK